MTNPKTDRVHDNTRDVGTCPDCGKRRYVTRKAARRVARLVCPGEQVSVYRCGDYFHFGHTPYIIARGAKARPS